jgi:hypothetical protein
LIKDLLLVSALYLLLVLFSGVVQSVFFVDEFFAASGALDNCSAVVVPCVGDQIGVAFELFLAVLTGVFTAAKKLQSY